tara:strand:+ start:588 stop:1052 length:465 start_codon:yes stop_codon:yes gene_type:complete
MDRRDDNFRNGMFTWFTGEVTKVASDGTNRVKVYPHGYYDIKFKDEKNADDLPWATVMMPCTSAGLTEIDGDRNKNNIQNHSLEVGSWVVGFFRDGPSAQDPIIMGVINGSEKPDRAGPNIKRHLFTSGAQITVNNNTGVIELSGSNAGKVRII